MTDKEKDFIANIDQKERETIEHVCELLRGFGEHLHNYLAIFVAHLCNIETDTMFNDTHDAHIAQARWLFWCAYRHLTNDTYRSMSDKYRRTDADTKFTHVAIRNGVIKMHEMIESEPIWAKRWSVIKHIIKDISNKGSSIGQGNATIEISVSNPTDVNICVNGVTIKKQQKI